MSNPIEPAEHSAGGLPALPMGEVAIVKCGDQAFYKADLRKTIDGWVDFEDKLHTQAEEMTIRFDELSKYNIKSCPLPEPEKKIEIKPWEVKEFYGHKFCSLQEPATQPGKLIFKKSDYWFGSFDSQDHFLDWLETVPEDQRTGYEMLMAGKPQKLFCDIDGQLNGFSYEWFELADRDMLVRTGVPEPTEILEEFIKHLKKCMEECKMTFHESDLIILDSCNDKKLSYHLVYNDRDGKVFKNCDEQRKFWDYVISTGEKFERVVIKYAEEGKEPTWERKSIIDTTVYTKNRAFRMAGCHKEGQPNRKLKPIRREVDRRGRAKYVETKEEVLHPKFLIMQPYNLNFYCPSIPNYESPVMFKTLSDSEIVRIIEQNTKGCVCRDRINGCIVPLENPVGGRKCLITNTTHASNNAYVVIGRSAITYHCHASECKGQKKVIHNFQSVRRIAPKHKQYYWQDCYFIDRWNETDLHDYFAQTVFQIASGGGTSYVLYQKDAEGKGEYYRMKGKEKPWQYEEKRPLYVLRHNTKEYGLTNWQDEFKSLLSRPNSPIKTYTGIWFMPYLERNPVVGSFNMFKPFDNNHDQFNYDKDVEAKYVQPILDHITKVYWRGDEKGAKWNISFLAHLIQRPHEKPGVAILYRSTGQQSACKSLFFEKFMPHVIGEVYHRYTTDLEETTEHFNSLAQHKLLTFVDELPDDAKQNHNKMKAQQTASRITITLKGVDSLKAKDFNRCIYASNHQFPLYLEENDERYACTDCGVPDGDIREYATKLAAAMGLNRAGECIDPMGPWAFFQYLKHYDISDWVPNKIPDTELRRKLMTKSVNTVKQFIAHLIVNRLDGCYQEYDQFCKSEGVGNPKGSRTFWAEVRDYVPDFCIRKRKHDGKNIDKITTIATKDEVEMKPEFADLRKTLDENKIVEEHQRLFYGQNHKIFKILEKLKSETKAIGYIEGIVSELEAMDRFKAEEAPQAKTEELLDLPR